MIKLKAERKVAYNSPDHLNPLGTSQDNSTNERFNRKIYQIFNSRTYQMKIPDHMDHEVRNKVIKYCKGARLV